MAAALSSPWIEVLSMTIPRYCIVGFLSYWLNLAAASAITVTANGEKLQGEVSNSIAIFRGIPFAKPPEGDLRWQAPQPHSGRKGLQTATDIAGINRYGQPLSIALQRLWNLAIR